MVKEEKVNWYEDDESQEFDFPIDYEILASPNDFNIKTIYDFIEAGSIDIPGFQRNYVWDINQASKLIESLITGLPVPQIFLYEASRNKFLVIDGQQRLMSIYYFIKQKFPKMEKRGELRKIFEEERKIPDKILHDEKYFINFNLRLPNQFSGIKNRFHGLNYSTMGEYKTSFDLRTIRNVIIKQLSPKDDDSAIYEIFNRLNTGGVNLRPQEIRMSLYNSEFLNMLSKINTDERWRQFLGLDYPDLHMKDIEILLRGFAILINGTNYTPSMLRFLNNFANEAKQYDISKIEYLRKLFNSFLDSCAELDKETFLSSNRFSIVLYESIFTASCKSAYENNSLIKGKIDKESVEALKNDQDFISFSSGKTSNTRLVRGRINRAIELIRIVC